MSRAIRFLLHPITRKSGGKLVFKIAVDGLLVALAVVAAYVTRFERIPVGTYGTQMMLIAPVLSLVRVTAWRGIGVYAQSWRLFGMREAISLAAGTFGVSFVLLFARAAMPYVAPRFVAVPFSVIALEGLFTLTGVTVVRVIARLFDEHSLREFNRREPGYTMRRALLVGAGRAGRLAARELRNRPDTGYEVVGFLDDDPARRGQVIEGVTVLGTTDAAAELAARTEAELFILTMPSVTRPQVRAVVERCRKSRLPVRTVPGFYELLGDRVEITKIRPLRVEDLLGRAVVNLDDEAWEQVRSAFAGKRIAVTGAGGSIGSELCRQLAKLDPSLLLLVENNENNLFDIDNEMRSSLGDRAVACLVDVRNESDIDRLFQSYRPEVVFHAAAYKHVPMMELHPSAAVDNNVRGTRCIARAAHKYGAERFLMISTDKAVHPANVMGASKRVAEMVVQSYALRSPTKFCCVRFGNVLGSRGSVLHTFSRQIESGGPVTVTHPDVTRFFMMIPEAVCLVIQAGAVGEGGEVFLLDMGEPVKVADMARQMIELAGFTTDDIPIEFIGLRPGEKLYEELLREEEGAEPSKVQGIFLAKLAPVEAVQLETSIARLERAADARDHVTIRRILATLTGYRASPDAPVTDDPSSARTASMQSRFEPIQGDRRLGHA